MRFNNRTLTKQAVAGVVLACVIICVASFWYSSQPLKSKMLPQSRSISVIYVSYEWPDAGATKYQTVHQVTSPKQITQIVSFVNHYRVGWASVLPAGLANPSGAVNLEFYQGTKQLSYWGIGPDAFKADGETSGVVYRRVKREEVNQLLSLLKLNNAVVPQK